MVEQGAPRGLHSCGGGWLVFVGTHGFPDEVGLPGLGSTATGCIGVDTDEPFLK